MYPDAARAAELQPADEAMNELHQGLLRLVSDDRWPHSVMAAVDVALLGRFYERFADHAVEVAASLTFQITGQWPHPPTPAGQLSWKPSVESSAGLPSRRPRHGKHRDSRSTLDS